MSAVADLHVVTSRQLSLQQATHSFLEQKFPDKFLSLQFGNHWGAIAFLGMQPYVVLRCALLDLNYGWSAGEMPEVNVLKIGLR